MEDEDEPPPAMPVLSGSSSSDRFVHREKIVMTHEPSYHSILNALVARPVGPKEINSNLVAKGALDKEWNNLETKGAMYTMYSCMARDCRPDTCLLLS